MKKSLSILFFLFTFLIAVSFLSAQAGGRLSLWSFTDEVEDLINNYFRRDNRAIQIDYSYITIDQFENRLDRVLASGRGAPDVIALEDAFVRRYVESGELLDLTDIYEANRDRLMAYPVEVGTYNGRVYALSWQACPGAMFYRRSLARKYLGTDDPRVVQTFFSSIDRMMETAEKFKEKSKDSCVLVSSINDLFLPFLYARSSPWVVNGRLVIDPAMERYMDVCKTLRDSRMEGRVGQWSGGWFDGMSDELTDANMKQTEVFSYFLPTWGLHYVLKLYSTNYDGSVSTAGDWAMIQGPVPYRWGGTWLAVNKNTQNPSAARELISYITANDSFQERWVRDTGDLVTNLAVIQRISGSYSEPFLGGQNHYSAFAEIAGRVNGSLAQATDQIIEDLFREELNFFLDGDKTKAQTLADFRRQVQSQLGLQ